MSQFVGKTTLVINTASKCRLTPEFERLESLYRKYHEQGLVILGFPCNQVARQDHGKLKENVAFCQLNYGVSLLMSAKVNVCEKIHIRFSNT
jgi:glutathione peroxidase